MADRGQAELQELDRVRRTVLEALGGSELERLQPALLQPAGELLARYGEELRGRACVVSDAHGGELFLLPDYTVPICRMHRERGGGAGRFVYAGPVFRLPDTANGSVPVEEQQVGLEVFEKTRTPEADAAVLCRTIAAVRSVAGQFVVTLGDAGIGSAILDSFAISERRRTRLLRRIGQPQRLRALLERFTRVGEGQGRGESLEPFAEPKAAAAALDGALANRRIPFIGRRRPEEVAARLVELAAEREEAPLPAETAARVEALLGLRGPFRPSLETLREAAGESEALSAAIGRLEDRSRLLAREGIESSRLELDLQLGSDLGYYDGLIFEIWMDGRRVAGGGRYDRLARDSGLDLSAVGAAVWIERFAVVSGRGS